jgi:hypothetical protein
MVTFADQGLEEIPRRMVHGTDITDLNLSGNRLKRLPEWVLEFPELRSLDLRGNRLASLPSQIGALRHLTELRLDSNKLTLLPPEIGALRRLRVLTARGNHLTELPPTLADLAMLQKLALDDNRFTELPDLIGDLDELVYLSARGNQLRSLPPSIDHLTRLAQLIIDGNDLSDLPEELAGLDIEILSLAGNTFETVPPVVFRLPRLRVLELERNRLTDLPPDIGTLAELELLDLRHNRLTRLPAETARLGGDVTLRLGGNPWDEPLPALVAGPPDRLFVYLRSLEHAEPQYEAKLILVGEGAVGKTSLLAALRGETFIDGRETTHGIERRVLPLPHPDLPTTELTLNAWDFGGQEVYRITHQFFFSERALYLMVWVPRQGQEQNEVAGWLRRIKLRVSDVKVLVVATHCDERNPELDYPSLQARFGDVLVGHVAVDNHSGTGIAGLRERLAQTAAALPQMGEPLSSRWAAAARTLRGTAQPQISRVEFDEICRREGLDEDETATLAHLLHDLGHIIHYADDDGLRDIVVLQPEWLTKAIGYVLEDTPTRNSGGVLEHRRLREIWSRDGASYPPELHPYFLRLMEKFDVSYRLKDEDTALDASLVAQLVPYTRPALAWEPADRPPEGIRRLALVCEMSDEAPGVIAWLTVRNHRFRTGVHWRHGVYLEHRQDESQALFVLDNPRQLTLTVRGPSPVHFFSRLRDSVEYLIAQRWPGLDHEFHVPCPAPAEDAAHGVAEDAAGGGGPCPGRFRLAALERRRERGLATVECQECFRTHDVLELLTGFPAPAQLLQPQLDRLQQTLNEVAADYQGLGRHMREIRDGVRRAEAHTAEISDGLRKVLKVTQAEVTDCPRLFTLVPERRRGMRRLRRWQDTYLLTLWCEEPGRFHAWDDAVYSIDVVPDRLAVVAPYATLVLKSLRLILPVAGVAGEILLGDVAGKALEAQLEDMKGLMDSAATTMAEPGGNMAAQPTSGTALTPAQGAGLRALRSLLFERDASRAFGGMRRVFDQTTGDILWVCPTHYRLYDPGLPDLSDPPDPPDPPEAP